MTKFIHTAETIGMGVSIGYTLICWLSDLVGIGNLHPGVRYELLFSAGVVTTIAGFLLALNAHRRRPVIARTTLASCLLWVVWSLMPRL